MCWACEEQDAMLWRYHLEMAVERGEIPEGLEPADFEAAGLPVPGGVRTTPAKAPHKPGNPFACDAPDGA
jgi:hypothetical protein